MMGLGYLGNGGSSSSSSNLSPLAPPFTVDRSNPKPNSNPIVHFTEPPYNWQYNPHSSASRPDFFSNRDSEIDSIRTTHVSAPSPNDYCYGGSEPMSTHWPPPNPSAKTETDSFSYLGEPKPYYPPYVSPVVNEENTPLVALNESRYDLLSTSGLVPMDGSSQLDYTQSLTGLEYSPHWGGFWNGMAEGKRAKHMEVEGSFCSEEASVACSHGYKNYMKQGAGTSESMSKCDEDSTISNGKYVDIFGRENRAGSLSAGKLDDKSFLSQNIGLISVESSKKPSLETGSMLPESHMQAPSFESSTNSWNFQNPYSPYEKRFQLFDSSMNNCTSVTKSSPSLVIRPPPVGTTISAPHTVSSKIGNITVNSEDVENPNPLDEKEDCLDRNQLSFFIDRKEKEELSNKLPTKNADHKFKARSGFQVSDINIPDGFPLTVDITEAVKSTTNSSDNLDSPCWKGAPFAQFSPFGTLEAVTLQPSIKKLEASHGLNHQGNQIFPPHNDFVKASYRELCESNIKNEDNGLSLSPIRTSDANFTAKDHKSSDCEKLSSNERVHQSFNDINKPRNEHDLPNGSKSGSGSKASHIKQLSFEEACLISQRTLKSRAGVVDTGINTNDGSGSKASHIKQLSFEEACLISQRTLKSRAGVVDTGINTNDASEDGSVPFHGKESTPKMNVQMLVNAMHNLSELLLFHCSNDVGELNEQDYESLKHVIGNLDACMSKTVHSTPTQESVFPQQGTSHKRGDLPDPHIGASAGRPQVTNEVAAHSHDQLDSQCMPQQKRNDVSGKKVEKFLDCVSLRDDADDSKYHNMVQAIKKVLDENFQCEEELPSQNLLYKNLWLEAEAELCSTSYRARFDRLKIEMEKCKSEKAQDVSENTMAVERFSGSKFSPNPNMTHTMTPEGNDRLSPNNPVQDSCVSSSTGNVEASVMARLNILKSRGDNSNSISVEEQQPTEVVDSAFSGKRNRWILGDQMENKSFDVAVGPRLQHHTGNGNEDKFDSYVDDSVMARFHILKSRGDNSKPINEEEQQLPGIVGGAFSGRRNHWQVLGDQTENKIFDVAVGPHEDKFGSYMDDPGDETVKEFRVCVADDPVIQSHGNSVLQNQPRSEWYDNSSLDWEHVLKDEFAWQN